MTSAYPAGSMWTLRRVQQDPLAFLQTLAAAGGDVVPCAVGRQRAFLLNHPDRIEDVLVRHPDTFVKGRGYARAGRLLGSGLLTAAAPVHAARRRVIQPAFQRQRLTGYGQAIVAHARRLHGTWTAGEPLDMAVEMQRLALAAAGATLFGVDLAPRADEVRHAVASAMPEMDGLIAVVAPPHRVRFARRQLESIVDGFIARRLGSGEVRDDLLDLLLAHQRAGGADLQQVRDDAITILLAGHDTISHALTWTWTLLAQHPDVDARLRAELSAVAGARPIDADDLPHLSYTRSVLAEALRLFPPAWVIVRRAVTAHRCGETTIPAGALVLASPFVTHRDERFFPAALQFAPDRWSAPEAGSRPRLAYFPFGAGPRSCIGEGFAWMEGTLTLATLAQAWRLTLQEPASVLSRPRMTLRPARPVMMTPSRSHGTPHAVAPYRSASGA